MWAAPGGESVLYEGDARQQGSGERWLNAVVSKCVSVPVLASTLA